MIRHRNAWMVGLCLVLIAQGTALARQAAKPEGLQEPPSTRDRVPMLDPWTPAAHLPPPTEQEIWDKIPAPKADPSGRTKVRRENVRFLIEKTGDKADDPKVYPLAGLCQLVHCHYRCTVYYDVITSLDAPLPHEQSEHHVEVVHLEKDFLRRCEKPDADELAGRVAKLEKQVAQLLGERGVMKAVTDDQPAAEVPEPHAPRAVEKPGKTYSGRVVGPDGTPVAGAKVTPLRLDDKAPTVLTDADGRFTIEPIPDDDSPAMITGQAVRVEAAGLARQMFVPKSDGDSTIRLQEGAPVSGRVLYKGRPLEDVEVNLVASDRIMPVFLGDWKAETDRHGRFTFKDIPKGHEFDLYFSIASLRNFGAIAPRNAKVGPRSLQVDVSDIEVGPSHKVAGVLKFSDGRAVPPGTVAHVSVEGGWSLAAMPGGRGGPVCRRWPAHHHGAGVVRVRKSRV